MTKELIERYLQFAIEHWKYNDFDWYEFIWLQYEIDHILVKFNVNSKEIKQFLCDSIIELITSWPFIEAIVRWIMEEWMDKNFYDTYCDCCYVLDLWDEFTKYQAIAIRDNKLDEFIKDLLPKE